MRQLGGHRRLRWCNLMGRRLSRGLLLLSRGRGVRLASLIQLRVEPRIRLTFIPVTAAKRGVHPLRKFILMAELFHLAALLGRTRLLHFHLFRLLLAHIWNSMA